MGTQAAGECFHSFFEFSQPFTEKKKCVLLFCACKIIKQMKKPKPCNTREIFLMYSNACRVLSQCNTRLGILYLLIIICPVEIFLRSCLDDNFS